MHKSPLEKRQLLKVDYGSQMGKGRPNRRLVMAEYSDYQKPYYDRSTMLTQLTKLRRKFLFMSYDKDLENKFYSFRIKS